MFLTYVMALEGRPAWAIEQSVRAIMRAEIKGISKSWAPKAPELAAIVESFVEPVRAEIRLEEYHAQMAANRRALPPPTIGIKDLPPDEKIASQERVSRLMEEFHKSMAAHTLGEKRKNPDSLDDSFWERANQLKSPFNTDQQVQDETTQDSAVL